VLAHWTCCEPGFTAKAPTANLAAPAPNSHAALERIGEPMTIAKLARVAHLSPRQFERRFVAAIGMSPGRWLIQQRIDASLPLLESGGRSIEQVAALVGFSPAGYRRHFRALRGCEPVELPAPVRVCARGRLSSDVPARAAPALPRYRRSATACRR
jgi:AraC-like DNA-binding protein